MIVEKILPAARKRLVTVTDNTPLIDMARLLRTSGADIVVVSDSDGPLIGVITKTDVVHQISYCEENNALVSAPSVMTREVISCRPSDPLHDVWATMKAHGLKNIPVVNEYFRPLGVLNARDALEVLLQEVEDEESLLRDYVMCVGYQ